MGSKNKILIILGIVVLFIIFVLIAKNNAKVKHVKLDNIDSIERNSIVFVGEYNNDYKERVTEYIKKYKMSFYILDNSIEEVNNHYNTEDKIQGEYAYLAYYEGQYKGFIDSTISEDKYVQYFSKFVFNTIPDDEIKYSKTTGEQYVKMVNSAKTTIAVLGTDSCTYCSLLEHVINDISKKNVYEIYYINKDRMSSSDYKTVTDLNLTIPSECTRDHSEMTTKDDFATPLTIVTKSGKLKGCILGYYDYDTYLSKLNKIMEG